ncbi:MAG TPA: hypothetical protein VGY56_18785 [Verrucomicrobiae bacterium]|nr:hypothetical protein [Verrucomicrobiae bacterium]
MKVLLTIPVPALLIIAALNGCKSESDSGISGYVSPVPLINQIQAADHIVVVSTFRHTPGVSHYAGFSMTMTGAEMNTIIRSISSLRAPRYNGPTVLNDCLYDRELQFYHGTNELGTADLGYCLVSCDGVDYHAPEVFRSLYHRIARESGEED